MRDAVWVCCAECLESMTKAKGELLTRIACANCQFAEKQRTAPDNTSSGRCSGLGWIGRCPHCGKWCWSRDSLALHRQLHGDNAN